jgi:CRISPR-associated endonuclease/helicase Cas3
MIEFKESFSILTGTKGPFPWQVNLYEEWFLKGKFPYSCNLPTGLGKTSVIAIWLIGLINQPDKIPRRPQHAVGER